MIEIIPNFHPVLVHFPIAFITSALAFTAVGALSNKKPYASLILMAGRWMLWGAVLFALMSAVFGWFAYNSVDHDEISHAAMTVHRNWALVTLAVLLALSVLDLWRGRAEKKQSPNFLILLMLAWLLMMTTAWHGGELVYRYGLGVMSLPKTAGHDHPHAHGDMQMPDEAALHEGGHLHGHDESVLDEASSSSTPATAIQGTTPQKVGHTHAPGTPPHTD
ncbi:DUF2231 domain-containing protein [Ferrigenium sp. UT5]|uniref:DUF2231 domain-containing protein n=1 Tax=Ferrigenium sp. UT5 TaxID=3242105 RepID=UPI00354C4446